MNKNQLKKAQLYAGPHKEKFCPQDFLLINKTVLTDNEKELANKKILIGLEEAPEIYHPTLFKLSEDSQKIAEAAHFLFQITPKMLEGCMRLELELESADTDPTENVNPSINFRLMIIVETCFKI